ncbi:MAG: peptidoglycan-associated lipoprotein [Candidatus Puniceispirillum sp.]|nr:peptidoglycan-associated lipoprotein [Candidatus Pelagibacter sp.]MBA4283176.1 peptidoglycan-associated lipoprotein [Candidatus Puniceispirillum sp.]
MKKQFFAIAAVALMLTACSDDQQEMDVKVSVQPGTAADFKSNPNVRDRVFFGFNESKVSKSAKAALESQATWLKTYSSTKATVEGKCDIRGTSEYNQALGQTRADATKKALVKMGVESDRLKTVSYGKERPEVPGDTPEAHAQNRVAITVID